MEGKAYGLSSPRDISDEKTHEHGEDLPSENSKKDFCEISKNLDPEQAMSNGDSVFSEPDIIEARRSKRVNESEEPKIDAKKIRPVIIDSDDEADAVMDQSVCNAGKVEDQSTLQENNGDSSDDSHLMHGVNGEFRCTACDRIAVEVHSHPLMKVIVCEDCKSLIEEKMHMKVWILIIPILLTKLI